LAQKTRLYALAEAQSFTEDRTTVALENTR
jgi:hypothetical protein